MQYTTILTPDLQAFGLTHGIRRMDGGVLVAAFRDESTAMRFVKILNGSHVEDETLEPASLRDPGPENKETESSGWTAPKV